MFLSWRLLKKRLGQTNKWLLYLKYVKARKKFENNRLRVSFLRTCLRNDLIPKFLMFRLPKNGIFEQTAVHNFQKRELRRHISTAVQQTKDLDVQLTDARNALKTGGGIPVPSIMLHSRIEINKFYRITMNTHAKKLASLAAKQDKPLRGVGNTVRVVGDITPPQYVVDFLSLGPKHPVMDTFKETHFLSDVDVFLYRAKCNGMDNEQLNEINSTAHWYTRMAKKQKPDKLIRTVRQYLKRESLKAVPFDKGAGYCLMSESDYMERLNQILDGRQFEKITSKNTKKDYAIKLEDALNKKLVALRRNNEISEDFYQSVKATGSQPARLYGLAKVHKNQTPLRPVLSLPGSCYANLDKRLAAMFQQVEGANIETSTKQIKDSLSSITLAEDEEIISLDVVSLYTNVPVDEAIDLAVGRLYSNDNTRPEMSKGTFKKLLQLTVKNVSFWANNQWYLQKDGVAMGAALAVILANIWLKQFEYTLSRDSPLLENATECGICKSEVTWERNAICCDICNRWYHRQCVGISLRELKELEDREWNCDRHTEQETKLFARYMDDIIRCIRKSDIERLMTSVNKLHQNLQFTVEKEDDGKIAFLDMQIHHVSNSIKTSWYSKPTDTGLILSFRACAPIRYKKNIIEGTIHRINNSTSTCTDFHMGLEKAIETWEANQYPPAFYHGIVRSTLHKILSSNNETPRQQPLNKEKHETKTIFSMQYRGSISDRFAKKLRAVANTSVVFTTNKMRSVLPNLKSKIDKALASRVVYKLSCPGCMASYVGQTSRHLTTRLQEHRRSSSPVGEHTRICTGDTQFTTEIIDRANDVRKLMTLEAIHIARMKPGLNTRDEFRSLELTLKL